MTDEPSAVSMRPMALGDILRVREWRNLPEIAAYMYTDHQISEEEHARWFGNAINDPTRRYWIIELEGAPVGLANLYDISTAHRRAYWAFYLASPEVRGRGVGAFAERFVMRHTFVDLDLEKLCCEVLATNAAVVKMHQRYGFQVDGTLRSHVVKVGERLDVVTMSLLRDDWASSRWSTND
jgi:UDP-4-amino-4,6-dideoxy-N-acetyl-beta-L-altrosamine N-acetyltransferase